LEYRKILAEPVALVNLNQKLMLKDCEAKGCVGAEVENAGSSRNWFAVVNSIPTVDQVGAFEEGVPKV